VPAVSSCDFHHPNIFYSEQCLGYMAEYAATIIPADETGGPEVEIWELSTGTEQVDEDHATGVEFGPEDDQSYTICFPIIWPLRRFTGK
jgi:hypothetical protein